MGHIGNDVSFDLSHINTHLKKKDMVALGMLKFACHC